MRADELMIGDWVQDDLGKPIQVRELLEYGINGEWGGPELLDVEAYYEDIEPIPITRGSLLYNGFHYYGVGLVREEIYVRSMDSNDDEWLVEYTSKDKTIGEVKKLSYVHELQNFLRSTDRYIDYQMPRV